MACIYVYNGLKIGDISEMKEVAKILMSGGQIKDYPKFSLPEAPYTPKAGESEGASLESKLLDSIWVDKEYSDGIIDVEQREDFNKEIEQFIAEQLQKEGPVLRGDAKLQMFRDLTWELINPTVTKESSLFYDPGLTRQTSDYMLVGYALNGQRVLTIQSHNLKISQNLFEYASKTISRKSEVISGMLFVDFVNLLTEQEYDTLNDSNLGYFKFKQSYQQAKDMLNDQEALYDIFEDLIYPTNSNAAPFIYENQSQEVKDSFDRIITERVKSLELIMTNYGDTKRTNLSEESPFNFIRVAGGKIIKAPTITITPQGGIENTGEKGLDEIITALEAGNLDLSEGQSKISPGLYTIFTLSTQSNGTVEERHFLVKLSFQLGLDDLQGYIKSLKERSNADNSFDLLKEYRNEFLIVSGGVKNKWIIEPSFKDGKFSLAFENSQDKEADKVFIRLNTEEYNKFINLGSKQEVINYINSLNHDVIGQVSYFSVVQGDNSSGMENVKKENAYYTFSLGKVFYRIQPSHPGDISNPIQPKEEIQTEAEILEEEEAPPIQPEETQEEVEPEIFTAKEDNLYYNISDTLKDSNWVLSVEGFDSLSEDERNVIEQYYKDSLEEDLEVTSKGLLAYLHKNKIRDKIVTKKDEGTPMNREVFSSEQKENLSYLLKVCL